MGNRARCRGVRGLHPNRGHRTITVLRPDIFAERICARHAEMGCSRHHVILADHLGALCMVHREEWRWSPRIPGRPLRPRQSWANKGADAAGVCEGEVRRIKAVRILDRNRLLDARDILVAPAKSAHRLTETSDELEVVSEIIFTDKKLGGRRLPACRPCLSGSRTGRRGRERVRALSPNPLRRRYPPAEVF